MNWWNEVIYGERWAEPAFNAIAFYLHVAGMSLFVRDNRRLYNINGPNIVTY
jgi:hypothetical protein